MPDSNTPGPTSASSLDARMPGDWKCRLLLMHIVLVFILLGNFVIRHYFEPCPIGDILELTGSFERQLLANPWGFLLPFDTGGQYTWNTTTVVLVTIVNRLLSPLTTFHLLNALLILASFWTSWSALRSPTFTLTYTVCMAVGTQFHYAYAHPGIVSLYIEISYLQLNMLCAYKLLMSDGTRGWWKATFVLSLLLVALGHETWLNYYVFLCAAAVFLFFFFRRRNDQFTFGRIHFVLAASTIVACIYVPIKVYYGRQHFQAGAEDELILGYHYPLLALEDFFSNFVTYVYMAVTNYFPPFLLSSNSDYLLGSDLIVAEQHGYHEAYGHLVPMHHLFYWYFHAGVVLTIFIYSLVRSAIRALRTGSAHWATAAVLLLMIACGSSTHLMIKYRPYMSVPSLTYKCMFSVVGTTLLISFLVMRLGAIIPRRAAAISTCIISGLIITSAMFRPAYLSHLNGRVGLAGYPNTLRGARHTVKRLYQRIPGLVHPKSTSAPAHSSAAEVRS